MTFDGEPSIPPESTDDVDLDEAVRRVTDLVTGEWAADRYGSGVHLFLSSSPGPASPAARAAFRYLEDALTAAHGAPTVPEGFEDEHVLTWSVAGRDISLQLFDHVDSTVMLSVEDHELAAEAERRALAAAHRKRRQPRGHAEEAPAAE